MIAHMRIRTCIEDDQSESGYIPDQQMATRYHKRGSVHSNEHIICHSYHQTRGRTLNSTPAISFKFTFIFKENLMLGSHQSPFILHELIL